VRYSSAAGMGSGQREGGSQGLSEFVEFGRGCSAPQQREGACDRVGKGIDADADGGVDRGHGSTRDPDGLAVRALSFVVGVLDAPQFCV
jgi:hypothetical protein